MKVTVVTVTNVYEFQKVHLVRIKNGLLMILFQGTTEAKQIPFSEVEDIIINA
jgi:hypothetical protein